MINISSALPDKGSPQGKEEDELRLPFAFRWGKKGKIAEMISKTFFDVCHVQKEGLLKTEGFYCEG